MAHYRKIDIRIALDKKFNALSRDSQLLFLYLLTHRHLTPLGAMHATLAGLASEFKFSTEEFGSAFAALCQQGMVTYDAEGCLLWLPNFLKYNKPESPNAIRSWESALEYLPECQLRETLIAHTVCFVQTLAPTFQEALPENFYLLQDLAMTPRESISRETPTHQPSRSPDANPSEGLGVTLPKGLCQPFGRVYAIPSEGLGVTLRKGLCQGLPIQEQEQEQEQEHRTISKEQQQEQEQKEEEIVLVDYSDEKTEIGEINNIVAPARQKTGRPSDADVVEVFRCWQRTLGHPQAQLDAKRRKIIRRALSSGYNFAQLSQAIKGCSQTPHNMGENEQGQRYDGLHIIFRDADQIDRFIRNAHSPPRRRTKSDQLFADNLAASDRWVAKKQQEAEKEIHAIE